MHPGLALGRAAFADFVVMTRQNTRVSVPVPHPALRLVSLGLLAFVFTLFSLELTLFGSLLAPLWFPTALMMVAFFRHPLRLWPAIALVCTLGNVAATLALFPPEKLNLLYAALNVLEAALGALLLGRLLPQRNPLQNLSSWVRLAIGGAVIPPLVGGLLLVILTENTQPVRTLFMWILSESIGALSLIPLGLLFKAHYLLRHRDPRLLLETLLTLAATLLLSWFALHYLPWPFTFIIVLLMWSAIRLPRLEAFTVFLATVMMVSTIMAANPALLEMPHPHWTLNAPWLPFLMILLPANVMTMVMYAFREERKHIGESEARFRNAMEYSAIGMALVSNDGQFLQSNKALCNLLGYTPEQLHRLTFQQLTWPEDLQKDLEQLDQLRMGIINSYSMEKRYYTSRGDVVWALLAVSVVRHTDGTPLYFIAQIEDITDLKQTEWMNKRLMERITLANEAGGIGIWEWDLGPDTMSWDKRMFELYDISPETKPTYQLWKAQLVSEDLPQVEAAIKEALRARVPFKLEFRIKVGGRIRHIRSLANRVVNKQGDVERLLGINMDMTEVKQLNDALFQEKERLHITLDSIGEAVICTDVEMNVTFMNPVAEKMSGWQQDRAIGQHILTILRITFGDNGPLMENIHSGDVSRTAIEQDVVLHCRKGGSYDIHYSITPLSTLDGQNIGFVLVIQDVTESRKMLRQLSYSASHDGLTHLANRVSFENHLKRLLLNVAETRQQHALVFIDLDRFKAVNDSAGHAAGDALLRELASLMLSMLRTSDVLARLGGDEFGLLLPDCNLESARTISGRLIQAINDYHFSWDNRLHRIGASAGITMIDANNNQASEVMSQADIACYASKNNGRGVVTVYEPQQGQHPTRAQMPLDEQWRMIKDNPIAMIARAVASPRVPESASFYTLTLKFWTREGDVMEEEALRAILGESELMHALDRRVFHEFFSKWSARVAQKGFGIALPLSTSGLASQSVVDDIIAMLTESPLPARLLHIMVPAEALHREDDAPRRHLHALRDAGCQIILTQTGRDLEVFNLLGHDRVDYVMLNAELVSWVHTNLMDEMMVTIIHGHAQRLGLRSIAGPADQPLVMDTLSGIGIDLIFGDTIAAQQPLDLLLNNSYFAIN